MVETRRRWRASRRHSRTLSLRLDDSRAPDPETSRLRITPDRVVKTQVRTTDILPTISTGCESRRRNAWMAHPSGHTSRARKRRTAPPSAKPTIRCASVGPLCGRCARKLQVHRSATAGVVRSACRSGGIGKPYQPSDLTVQKFRGMLAKIKAEAPASPAGAAAQHSQARTSPQSIGLSGPVQRSRFRESARRRRGCPIPKTRSKNRTCCTLP